MMSNHIDFVPKWLRILVGALAALNILFGVMGYFDMSLFFKYGSGLDLTNAILKNASYAFAARNLAIGLGLAIVAAKGVPESITIVAKSFDRNSKYYYNDSNRQYFSDDFNAYRVSGGRITYYKNHGWCHSKAGCCTI